MANATYDIEDIKRRMHGASAALQTELSGLRTGRASAHLLDPVMVEAYGSQMPLVQVASVTIPEPRMIAVNVWDKTLVHATEKAIVNSNLGLSPATDGQTIRLRIPELNQDRRKELVKLAHKYAEAARVAVRHVRRDAMDTIKKMEKDQRHQQRRTRPSRRRNSKGDRCRHRRSRSVAGRQGKGNPHRLRSQLMSEAHSPPSTKTANDAPAPHAPRHVAIIMDGNGRWASARGLPRVEGHRRGVEALRRTIRAAGDIGIKVLTIFSFSSENWSRPAAEVGELMGLLRRFIRNDLAELHKSGVRVRIIGERAGLDADIGPLLVEAEELTKDNAGLTLVVAFNYGARQEIARAARRIARGRGTRPDQT